MKKALLLLFLCLPLLLLSSCQPSSGKTGPRPEKPRYFDYNGKLHVEGSQLLNQYGEPILLNGVNIPYTAGNIHSYDDRDRLNILKTWGFNFVRIGFNIEKPITEEMKEALSGVLDHLISIGFYIDLTAFNDYPILEKTENLEATKAFLTYFAEKYKDCDNIIYSIGNEPQKDSTGKQITMAQIDEYAEVMIAAITKYKSDALIACPTPYADSEVDDAAESTIRYKNILYLCHCYQSETLKCYNVYRRIQTALANGKCVYLSEWSAATPSTTSKHFAPEEALNTWYLIRKYNLPNSYYNYFTTNRAEDGTPTNMMPMLYRDHWDTQYTEPEALTPSGKFILNALKSKNVETYGVGDKENYTIINGGYSTKQYFWVDKYRSRIKRIIFETSTAIPNDVVEAWNLSSSGLGELYAYVKKNGKEDYDVLIRSPKTIFFPEASANFFNDFPLLESISFSAVDTHYVTSMSGMFSNLPKLKSLDLSLFDTSNVTNMFALFNGSSSLEELDLSSFRTDKVENCTSMFNGSGIRRLDLRNCNFQKVGEDECKYMFAGASPEIFVSSEETKAFLLARKSTLTIRKVD